MTKKLLIPILFVAALLVGCSPNHPGKPLLLGWDTVKFRVNPTLPDTEKPVDYTVLIAVERSAMVKVSGDQAQTVLNRWIAPMFIYVSGHQAQIETQDIGISAEGTTFCMYFPTPNDVTVFHYAHNLHSSPDPRVVHVKANLSSPTEKHLDVTSQISLHRSNSASPWTFVDSDKVPFDETFDTSVPPNPTFSNLDATRKDWLETMHDVAEKMGINPD